MTTPPAASPPQAARRAGTRGDYGIVLDGSFYGVHQPRDGYLQAMGSRLAGEASQISAGEWRRIGAAVSSIEWVVPSDARFAGRGGAAVPAHPDGDFSGDGRNLEFLVPRQSRAETDSRIRDLLDARPGGSTLLRPDFEPQVVTVPSFRGLAAMSAATKATAPFSDDPSPFTVVADLDGGELGMWFSANRTGGSMFGSPYSCLALSDSASLSALASDLAAAMASTDPPPRRLERVPRLSGRNIGDGMTRRPRGFPQFADTPRRPQPPTTPTTPSSAAVRLCGARLSPGRPDSCGHPLPARVNGACQAGHRRRR